MNREVPGQLELVFDVPTLTDDLRAELTAHVLDGWQGTAACRSTALDVCGFCPVRRSCLAYALADDEDYGVWGGTTEVQRDVLRQTLADDMSVPDVLDQATLLPAYIWRAAS